MPFLLSRSPKYWKHKILLASSSFIPVNKSNLHDNIKIMPCVEGDRSDCQPEASSIARSRRLRAMVVVEG